MARQIWGVLMTLDVDVLVEDLAVEIKSVLEGDVPVRPGRVFDLDKLLKALEGYLEAQK